MTATVLILVTGSGCRDVAAENQTQTDSPAVASTPEMRSDAVRRRQYNRAEMEAFIQQIDAPDLRDAGLALQSLPCHPGHFEDDPGIVTAIVIPALTRIMTDARRPSFQGLAATKLMTLGDAGQPALPALFEALKNPALRPFVAQGISQMGPTADQAVPRLAAMLTSEDVGIIVDACRGLGNFGKRAAPALPELTSLLKGDDVVAQVAGILAIGAMGAAARGALDQLERMLASTSDSVRLAAGKAIAAIKSDI